MPSKLTSSLQPGHYLISTPIGNLDDISKRALRCLRMVDLCAAEDTRISKKLFRKYDIQTNIISYHQFSEKEKLVKFIFTLSMISVTYECRFFPYYAQIVVFCLSSRGKQPQQRNINWTS